MEKKILIINAGSSSVKFKVFTEDDKVIASGLCERIYTDGNFKIKYFKDGKPEQFEQQVDLPNHDKAIDVILDAFVKFGVVKSIDEFIGVGHRVVQAGIAYSDSSIADDACCDAIEKYIKLAPLHNPSELKVIKIFKEKLPNATEVCAFDTSFHYTIPPINHTYPINEEIAKKYEIKRYGMHGISYRYITKKMQEILGKKSVNLIICHIGNGASICCVKDSKSYDTTMGVTPLEGLMMGTRCGDIDPSIALYLLRMGMTGEQIDDLFNKKSGLYGFMGSADLRDTFKAANAGDEKAKFVIKLYESKIIKYIVQYANELEGKIDAIVFTAGVGENQINIVGDSLRGANLLHIKVDDAALAKSYADHKLITTSDSPYKAYMVRTDEELMICEDVKRLSKK